MPSSEGTWSRESQVRSRVLLIVGAALGGALLLELWRSGARGPVSMSMPVARGESMALLSPPLDSSSSRAALPVRLDLLEQQPPPSVQAGAPARTFLAEYYGEVWPEVEARILAWGQIDLETPYTFTPWEDVQEQFEGSLDLGEESARGIVANLVQWPETLTLSYIKEQFQLGRRSYEADEADLLMIEALVASKNDEIKQIAELFAERVEYYVHEQWYRGDYLRAPFTTAGLTDLRGFHSQSHGGFGWAVTITLTREAYPDMGELERQALERQGERAQIVYDYLLARADR